MILQILAHFIGVILRYSKAWICFWFIWMNREILTFFSGPHPLGSHPGKAETSNSMTTSTKWTRATFLCFTKSTHTLFITCLWPLRSPAQNFISTYEQEKCTIPAESQITPATPALSFVISPLPAHPTQFLKNVAHVSYDTLVVPIPGKRMLLVHFIPKHNWKMCLLLSLNSSQL